MSSLLFLALAASLFVGVPVALWRVNHRKALNLWPGRPAGTEHVAGGSFREADVTRYEASVPLAVRLAALGCWILGVMFVPGLLVGVWGLLFFGIGLASIPGLVLAARLFLLGGALLRGDAGAAERARSAARFARWLNYAVLALCGASMLWSLGDAALHNRFSVAAFPVVAFLTAVYACISLAHAGLLERAASLVDAEQDRRVALATGVRVSLGAADAPAPGEAAVLAPAEEPRRAARP